MNKIWRAFRLFFVGLGNLIKKNIDMRDVHFYAGTALLAVGCSMIYEPAGYMVAGIVLLFIALRR